MTPKASSISSPKTGSISSVVPSSIWEVGNMISLETDIPRYIGITPPSDVNPKPLHAVSPISKKAIKANNTYLLFNFLPSVLYTHTA